jgi:hypothetical protein
MRPAPGTRHSALSPLTFCTEGRQRSWRSLAPVLKKVAITILFLCCCLFTFAQNNYQDKDQGQGQSSQPLEPTITFDRYWEAATPQDYTITVKSSGEAKYVSRDPTRPEAGSEAADPDYSLEFTMSTASSDRIFTLARETNYFSGDFDYKHKIANTGKKTLSYADPVRRFQTTYNYSENKNIQEVTKLFEGISATIEHGRKLQFMRRFDKLSLDAELKSMEELAKDGYLTEIQIIAPLLQNIVNDTSVLHMARQRAQRLLAAATTP